MNLINLLESEKPTLIKVFSESCGPCKFMKPILKELEKENPSILFAEIDGPENRELMKQNGISKVPTFLFVKNGKVAFKLPGATSKVHLQTLIKDFLN